MHSLDTFRHRTHTRNEGDMPTESIGIAGAHEIASRVNWNRLEELANEARRYLDAVQAEIATLEVARERHAARLARRALLFGVATPHRDERQSIGWALTAEQFYDDFGPVTLSRLTYRSPVTGNTARMGMREMLAASLRALQTHLPSPIPETVHYAHLQTLPGIGPKVARMIHAVTHPRDRVWTVDIWHMRQLLWAAGLEYRVKPSLSAQAYETLEHIWLEYAERFFPGTATWAVQWATWCAAEGAFLSHAALWQDLAA